MIKNTQHAIEPPTTSCKLWTVNIYNVPSQKYYCTSEKVYSQTYID